MTEKAIEFLPEWISEKVHAPETPVRLDQKAEDFGSDEEHPSLLPGLKSYHHFSGWNRPAACSITCAV